MTTAELGTSSGQSLLRSIFIAGLTPVVVPTPAADKLSSCQTISSWAEPLWGFLLVSKVSADIGR